jgi:ABC-type multidrug transport system ATPase subunit/ABC-type multidrug transport system permease subunit
MMENHPAISVRHLSKSFTTQAPSRKIVHAVRDVSIDIHRGEVLGILGPNGAGKTTFLNILSTLLLPDEGTVEILGIPSIPKNHQYLRTLFNMSSGYSNYPWSLTVEENLRFYGKLYGLSRKELTTKLDELMEMFTLKDYAGRRFDELSSGTKQRLSLAKALLNDPKIVFLDEPTVGLDPDAAAQTREIISRVMKKRNVTVLLTTHNMDEAENLCGRIAFIKEGQLIKLGSPRDLKESVGKKDLEELFIELAKRNPSVLTERVSVFSNVPKLMRDDENIVIGRRFNLRKWARRCAAFSYRNFLFAARNVFAFVELLFWPMVSLISIGLLGDYLELRNQALAFILTGAIAAGILQVTQLDVAYSLLYEVWSKSMKHTMLTPIGISEHLIGSWMIGMLRGVFIFIVLGLSAIAFFGFQFPPISITLVFLLGLFCCAFLLGSLVSVLILTFGQKAEITAWMFSYVFMLLCGIYYPVETLPPFFLALSKIIPITYFLEYFRQSFGFVPLHNHVLLKGFLLCAVYWVVALIAMKEAFHQARKKGIIIRLSE